MTMLAEVPTLYSNWSSFLLSLSYLYMPDMEQATLKVSLGISEAMNYALIYTV